MYKDAFMCHACGFLSKFPGAHCNVPMVSVVVLESAWPEDSPAPRPREIIREIIREVPAKKEEGGK